MIIQICWRRTVWLWKVYWGISALATQRDARCIAFFLLQKDFAISLQMLIYLTLSFNFNCERSLPSTEKLEKIYRKTTYKFSKNNHLVWDTSNIQARWLKHGCGRRI